MRPRQGTKRARKNTRTSPRKKPAANKHTEEPRASVTSVGFLRKERKLDKYWSRSRLLVQISEIGVAGYGQEFYRNQGKQYHLDNIKTYYPHAENQNLHTMIHRTEMACDGFPGQNRVDLSLLFV